MAQFQQPPRPVLRAAVGLHPDQAWHAIGEMLPEFTHPCKATRNGGFGLGRKPIAETGHANLERVWLGAFPISRSSAVCRQRWTVRLGEVEPVFGQTGRVVLDITARTEVVPVVWTIRGLR